MCNQSDAITLIQCKAIIGKKKVSSCVWKKNLNMLKMKVENEVALVQVLLLI